MLGMVVLFDSDEDFEAAPRKLLQECAGKLIAAKADVDARFLVRASFAWSFARVCKGMRTVLITTLMTHNRQGPTRILRRLA